VFAFAAAIAIAAFPGQVTPASPHYDLEVMYSDGDYAALDAAIDVRLKAAPDADLYWMKARVMYELGELLGASTPAAKRLAHYERMLAMADAGLALRPGDAHLRFARGIAMARIGTTKGVLSSLFMAKDIESDWLAATTMAPYASVGGEEVLPADAYLAIGVFYRLVPDWWIVQVLAGTRGDLDKSLSYVERAVAGRATIDNIKELAAIELCIATTRGDAAMLKRGNASLARALSIPAHDEKSRIDHTHVRMLQADPSLACEYSRDGQQDLDQAKLEAKR